MSQAIGKLASAWQQVAKRSLSHWRLLSSVVLGVLLASAIMAGTVIYYDALREVALEKTLGRFSTTELDILMLGQRGPTTADQYDRVKSVVYDQIDQHVDWLMRDKFRAGKTPTFFLTTPGNEGAAGKDNARTYFAFLPGLAEHTNILPGGALPRDELLNAPGDPPEVEVLVPVETAQESGVSVGDRLNAVLPWTDRFPYVTARVSGVFERTLPVDEEFWDLEQSVLSAATGPTFRTVPFYLSEKSFLEVLGPTLPKMESAFAWLLAVDPARVNARNAEATLAHVEILHSKMAGLLSSYRQTTALDNALREYERRLFFNKLPMFVVLVLIAIVILYYVATLSALAVEERRSEVALLRSRGATSGQILVVFVLEGTTIAALAVLVGPLLAATAISALGYTPAFSDLTGGGRLEVSISSGAYLMSAIGGVLSFVALIVPAIRASRIGVTRHRQQAARPSTVPAFQRYYGDVLLLLMGIYLFRQLTEQGSVVAISLFGEVAVNQLLLAVPGLILVASAMVLLRLFPLVMLFFSRILSRWLSAGPVMAVWQMARNPTHYARLSLLLILTAGLGIFASSFSATLERSFKERVLYSTGSDIRIDGVRPLSTRVRRFSSRQPVRRASLVETYGQIDGVDEASPVLRATGYDLSKTWGQSYTMFAVEASSFDGVAWFRDDFAERPMKELLGTLQAGSPLEGIQLPLDARTISVRLRPDRPQPSVRVTARVRDANEQYSTYILGTLASREWDVLEAALTQSGGGLRQPDLPLTLVSLRVHEPTGNRRLQPGAVLIDDLWVTMSDGEQEVLDFFDDPSKWSVLKTASDAVGDVLAPSDIRFNGDSGSVLFSWTTGAALTARGIFHGSERAALPVLASRTFMRASGHKQGEVFDVSVSGHRVPVVIADTVDLFPTVTVPHERFMVADLTSLIRYANQGAIIRELNPNGIWLSADSDGESRDMLIRDIEAIETYSIDSIQDREERLAESKVDPLVEAGWRALLFIAFSAVLILSCLGFLVHAYVSFHNRQLQFALLRTVGLSMKQLVTMVWLEQALVIAAGMALGTWMGGRLGATIMPFLGHDDWGGQVVPPFAMEVNWGPLLLTYAAMLLAFAIISFGLVWFIHRISLQRILRLGEM